MLIIYYIEYWNNTILWDKIIETYLPPKSIQKRHAPHCYMPLSIDKHKLNSGLVN